METKFSQEPPLFELGRRLAMFLGLRETSVECTRQHERKQSKKESTLATCFFFFKKKIYFEEKG
jgi:hypothetical protein